MDFDNLRWYLHLRWSCCLKYTKLICIFWAFNLHCPNKASVLEYFLLKLPDWERASLRWWSIRVPGKKSVLTIFDAKHCQRHNGTEGWVLLTKVSSLGRIANSYTNLDQILPEDQLQNLNQTLKPCPQSLNKNLTLWPNFTFQICTKLLSTRFSSSTSTTVTTSTSFELPSSHARITSIKFTKQEWVRESVS